MLDFKGGWDIYTGRIKEMFLLTVPVMLLLVLFGIVAVMSMIFNSSYSSMRTNYMLVSALFFPFIFFFIFLMLSISISTWKGDKPGIIEAIATRWKPLFISSIMFTVILLALMFLAGIVQTLFASQYVSEMDSLVSKSYQEQMRVMGMNATDDEKRAAFETLVNSTLSDLDALNIKYSTDIFNSEIASFVLYVCAFILLFTMPFFLSYPDESSVMSRIKEGIRKAGMNIFNTSTFLVLIFLIYMVGFVLLSVDIMLSYFVQLVFIFVVFPLLLCVYAATVAGTENIAKRIERTEPKPAEIKEKITERPTKKGKRKS